MASLQAKHSVRCPLPRWTTYDAAKEGCKCPYGPTYYVPVRDGRRTTWKRVGKNAKVALREFRKIQVQIDDDAFEAVSSKAFEEWADEWIDEIEVGEGTLRSYRSTMRYAKTYFRRRAVRSITSADVSKFNVWLRDKGLSSTTRHKHLSTLGTSFEAAQTHRYASKNPVHDLPKSSWPKKEANEAAYFENDELARLFAALEPGALRMICLLAALVGLRIGEILGLRWHDIDLPAGVARVRRSWSGGKLGPTKHKKKRDADLVCQARDALLTWRGLTPDARGSDFLFATHDGRPLDDQGLREALYDVMELADVPRVGPTGEERSFHAFRHTFAKISLEEGVPITWLKEQLGHSTITVTVDRYGHWERAARRRHLQTVERAIEAVGVFTSAPSKSVYDENRPTS